MFNLHRHAELASTNDEARQLAEAGAPHGTAIQAAQQTAGRGRHGRHWISPTGNLHISIILRLPGLHQRGTELAFVTALAAADAVDTITHPLSASLKWPNDVLLAEAKVAGILLEAIDVATLIAGIGINVAHAPTDLPYPATALARHAPNVTVEQTLTALLTPLEHWWTTWVNAGFAPIRTAWLHRGPKPGQPLTVQRGQDRLHGQFAGLAEDGALLLNTPNGPHRVITGDVTPG